MTALAALLLFPLVPLGITALNQLTWTRGRPADGGPRPWVLIPARNEEAVIGDTVRAALRALPPHGQLVVFDDASTDATPEILAGLAAQDRRLHLARGTGLPAGWVGKPHACHQLALRARAHGALDDDLYVFVDADTRLAPDGLRRLQGLAADHAAHVVTAVPRQLTGSWAEHLLLPLLLVTYTSWLPLVLVHRTSNPAFCAANGQVLAVGAAAYERVGGFAAVAREVVDDMAFCRLAKRRGLRVVFADGHHLATTRMYTSARGVWDGFSKNLYEGVGGHPLALGAVLTLQVLAFLLPWLVLPWALAVGSSLALPAAVGVAANLAQRTLLAARYGHRLWAVVAHPLAVVGLCAIAINSALWSATGRIRWSGRTYPTRSLRGVRVAP